MPPRRKNMVDLTTGKFMCLVKDVLNKAEREVTNGEKPLRTMISKGCRFKLHIKDFYKFIDKNNRKEQRI